MVRMMSTEPCVFFPGKRLQWLTPSANGMHMIMVRGVLSLILAMAMVVFAAGNAMSDHDIQTYTFEFTGSTNAGQFNRQDFIINQDGALYFKLKSVTTTGPTTNPITIGFYPKNQYLCSFRYASTIENPTVGQTYGPYYVAAGTYQSHYALAGVATTNFALDIEYHRQLTPNDAEPNDSMTTPADIGNISPNDHITGHLAYLEGGTSGCHHDKKDHIRFGVLSSGNYRVNIHYDPTFSDKPGCVVWFNLYDETAGSWLLNHTGPTDTTLGPIAFQAGRQYIIVMESSTSCYDTIFLPGDPTPYVVGNKAGAYDIQIYDPTAPPPVTIRLASVEKEKKVLDKKPNQKYLIVDVENFGTSSQVGYIEITVVDNNRNLPVFSDHRDITVPAAATGRYDFYADTTNWPTTQIKATASLYTANKQQFLGSGYAIFECADRSRMPGLFLLLLGGSSVP
jgi:hypothetical protein